LDGWHCAILDHDDFHQDIATGVQQGLDTGRPTWKKPLLMQNIGKTLGKP
jgi:hypothetical protein